MDEEQRFAFDTWGFLTVEQAITPEQVAELKATVDPSNAFLNQYMAEYFSGKKDLTSSTTNR